MHDLRRKKKKPLQLYRELFRYRGWVLSDQVKVRRFLPLGSNQQLCQGSYVQLNSQDLNPGNGRKA